MTTHSCILAWRIPERSLVGCQLRGHTELVQLKWLSSSSREGRCAALHGVTKNQTQLGGWTTTARLEGTRDGQTGKRQRAAFRLMPWIKQRRTRRTQKGVQKSGYKFRKQSHTAKTSRESRQKNRYLQWRNDGFLSKFWSSQKLFMWLPVYVERIRVPPPSLHNVWGVEGEESANRH